MAIGQCTRRLAIIAALALPLFPGALAGQERAGQTDSIPTFDALSVRILKLKVQVQTLRARLSEDGSPLEGSGPAAGRKVWSDSVDSVRSGVSALKSDANRLRQAYERAKHATGSRLVRELTGIVTSLEEAAATLSDARDAHAARIQISHLTARLDAMLERVAEAQKCCRITLEQ